MDKHIWSLYKGKLVYQKRKNGLFYDGKTHERLNPQPDMNIIGIEVYRDTIEDHDEDNNLSKIFVTKEFAEKYYNERISHYNETFKSWIISYTADETEDFYQYAKEHNAIIEVAHC